MSERLRRELEMGQIPKEEVSERLGYLRVEQGQLDAAQLRKETPIWTGVMMYFPAVWGEVAKVSAHGNAQHNPGEPLHWAREKSTDQMDAAIRHMLDHGTGKLIDTDGMYHLAKAIWRLCAELQLTIEKGAAK